MHATNRPRPTIGIHNHAGGPGKSTTTRELAYHLASMLPHRPTVFDLDSQGDLSRLCGADFDCVGRVAPGLPTASDVIMGHISLTDAERITHVDGVAISYVAADTRLEETAAYIQAQSPNHKFLQRAIRRDGPSERPLLLDGPPRVDITVTNLMMAVDWLIIPVQPEEKDIAAMHRLLHMLNELREDGETVPKIMGTVITKYDQRTVKHRLNCELLCGEGYPTVLGVIPLRNGRDAEQSIRAAYEPVAQRVTRLLTQEGDA